MDVTTQEATFWLQWALGGRRKTIYIEGEKCCDPDERLNGRLYHAGKHDFMVHQLFQADGNSLILGATTVNYMGFQKMLVLLPIFTTYVLGARLTQLKFNDDFQLNPTSGAWELWRQRTSH